MKRIAVPVSLAVLLSACNNAAEQTVREELIDPGSAKFRDTQRCSGDSKITTGEVNGKNRLGAYTGFEPFFVEGNIVHFAGSPSFIEVMERCYDTSASSAEAQLEDEPSDLAEETNGDWLTNRTNDPIDDSAVITATLNADSGQSSYGDTVSIVARCGSNKTALYAIWHDYVGDDSSSPYYEFKNVEVRVGDASAETQRWDVSTDKEATFAPSPVPLLKKMAKAEKLALRMTPYGENPITAVFQLKGINEALAPIAKECNWELE